MQNQINIKQVINGKSYNTRTASLIHTKNKIINKPSKIGTGATQEDYKETLYRTLTGTFFRVRYDVPIKWNANTQSHEIGNAISPLNDKEARDWIADHCPEKLADFLDNADIPKSQGNTLTIRIDPILKAKLAAKASTSGQSMNLLCTQVLSYIENPPITYSNPLPEPEEFKFIDGSNALTKYGTAEEHGNFTKNELSKIAELIYSNSKKERYIFDGYIVDITSKLAEKNKIFCLLIVQSWVSIIINRRVAFQDKYNKLDENEALNLTKGFTKNKLQNLFKQNNIT